MMNHYALLLPLACLIPTVSSAQSSSSAKRSVTFTQHVAPIVFNNCTSCHRPNEGAPFSLTNYAETRKKGRMIARVTKKGFMPPWHPVKGHGEFKGTLGLTDRQVRTLDDWVKGGMPEGNPQRLPKMPKFTDGWKLGTPDLVVKMPKAFPVPAGGPDIYRNFFVPVGLQEDKWVTAIEVRPGDRTVLHHIIFGIDTNGSARKSDGRDGKPGFSGMRGGGRGVGTSTAGLGGWAVGGQPNHLPMGLARHFPKGSDLILRSHFHPAGKATEEQTTIGLYFTDKAPKRTMVGLQLPPNFGITAGLNIPAGEKEFKISGSFTLPVDVQALTVGGHAHYICKKMQVTVTPPGSKKKKSIFFIDDWAFNWQNRYLYKKPLPLRRGSKIDVVITYDNSAENPSNPHDPPRRVRWGLQSTDEMGSVTILMVAKREKDTNRLKRAIRDNSRNNISPDAGAGLAGAFISQIKMMDQNGDGKIEEGEVPERMRRLFKGLDTNGDGVVDDDELENMNLFGGRRRR